VKSYILLPFVLLAGLVIGGLGPRSELARVKEELAESQKLVRGQGKGTATMTDVSNLLGIERKATVRSRAPLGSEVSTGKDEDAENVDAEATVEASEELAKSSKDEVDDGEDGEEGEGEKKEKFGDDLDNAIELWQARVAIAKSTFIANARLSDTQALKFKTLLGAMNVRIGTSIDGFAEEVRESDNLQPETGVRLVNDITDSMVMTYDEMDKTMPKGWRGKAGDKFSMTDFVDPEVARPLVGLDGKLGQFVR
jgi:hypothetical protein